MIRLLIVEALAEVRKGLFMSLDAAPDFLVVGEAADCENALQLVNELKPDVIVIDLDMPRGDGFALTEMLRIISPRSAVIMLSIHDDALICARAEKAGVAALVDKSLPAQTLLSTIRAFAG